MDFILILAMAVIVDVDANANWLADADSRDAEGILFNIKIFPFALA